MSAQQRLERLVAITPRISSQPLAWYVSRLLEMDPDLARDIETGEAIRALDAEVSAWHVSTTERGSDVVCLKDGSVVTASATTLVEALDLVRRAEVR